MTSTNNADGSGFQTIQHFKEISQQNFFLLIFCLRLCNVDFKLSAVLAWISICSQLIITLELYTWLLISIFNKYIPFLTTAFKLISLETFPFSTSTLLS